jgi:hypothetical protein
MTGMTLLLALLLQAETVPLPDSKLTFEVVRVPAGKDVPAFSIGRREVSWAEFRAYYREDLDERHLDGITRPSKGIPFFGQVQCPDRFLELGRPVINLRWHSAVSYADWLTKKTGAYWRLPTEPEWELACGAPPANLDESAWHAGNAKGEPHPVGTAKPNALGLFDMVGNVWEYVLEHDGGPGYDPVLRGGAWSTDARPGSRTLVPPEWFKPDPQLPKSVWWLQAEFHQGFRVVRAADAAGKADREAAAKKVQIKIADETEPKVKDKVQRLTRVKGEIANTGDRDLIEVEVTVYPLDEDGKPVFVGPNSQNEVVRALFSKAWPVLASSRFPDARAPLKKGETRKFELDLPAPHELLSGKHAGIVTNVRFE